MNEILLAQIEKYLQDNYENPADIKYSIGRGTWSSRLKRRIETFIDSVVEDSFTERLRKLIQAKGKTDVEVYKKAHLDRRLFSKIRTDKKYKPSEKTAVALAIALELDITETQDLLQRAGYYLSVTSKEDLIIRYFIEHQEYDLFLINEVLYHYGFKPLGD